MMGSGLLIALLFACTLTPTFSRRPASSVHLQARTTNENDLVTSIGCPSRNPKLASWLKERISGGVQLIPQSVSFDAFVLEIKNALEQNHLPLRTIEYLFADGAPFNPSCSGLWMEFGVFRGDTINFSSQQRLQRCGNQCTPVFGFDTFTGLPEKWSVDDQRAYSANAFDTGGNFPPVNANVQLVKGLFSDSLPVFLKEQAKFSGGNETLSYLHIDCDLYAGSRDAFNILNDRIKPGTIILFDELVNYAKFRDNEIKAFWEWLQMSGAKVIPIGIAGPLPGKNFAVDLDIKAGEHPWFHQSAAFVVVSN